MKQIVIILSILLSFAFTAEGNQRILGHEADTISATKTYPLHTVILYPANGGNGRVISARLVFEDNTYKLSYNGKIYAFRSIEDTSFDSSVNIDGQNYVFRLKPRPYE